MSGSRYTKGIFEKSFEIKYKCRIFFKFNFPIFLTNSKIAIFQKFEPSTPLSFQPGFDSQSSLSTTSESQNFVVTPTTLSSLLNNHTVSFYEIVVVGRPVPILS